MRRRLKSTILTILLLSFLWVFCYSLREDNKTYRHELPEGVENIVKRARQMTDIEWTPQADVTGWNNELIYKAGVTYVGLPYGQPIHASYVPWNTGLDEFVELVNNPNSKMYTEQSDYIAAAPYYSCDCSSFVSWAWGLDSIHLTSTLDECAKEISRTSYEDAEVGDCFCKSHRHVVLITDITYDKNDNITGIEISESTINFDTNFCCQRVWYGENYEYSLEYLQSKYLDSGYILYRCTTRDNVSYTHSCAVPLDGDSCQICGRER